MEESNKRVVSMEMDENKQMVFSELSEKDIKKLNPVVYKNNKIIQASGFTTIYEIKLFIGLQYLARTELDTDPDKTEFSIPLSWLKEILWIGATNNNRIEETIRNLTRTVIEYNVLNKYGDDDEIERGIFPLLKNVRIRSKKNSKEEERTQVYFSFNDPILTVIKSPEKSSYTKLSINAISRLNSFASLTIYQLVKQYQNIIREKKGVWDGNRWIKFTEEEIRILTQTRGLYSEFNKFKKNVLEQAKKDINKRGKDGERNTDIKLEYKTNRIGKGKREIRFTYTENKLFNSNNTIKEVEEKEEKYNEILSWLWNIGDEAIDNIWEDSEIEELLNFIFPKWKTPSNRNESLKALKEVIKNWRIDINTMKERALNFIEYTEEHNNIWFNLQNWINNWTFEQDLRPSKQKLVNPGIKKEPYKFTEQGEPLDLFGKDNI